MPINYPIKLASLRKRPLTDWIGGTLVLLGMVELAVTMADFSRHAGSLFMSSSIALGFILSGGALLAQCFAEFRRRRLQMAFGGILLLFVGVGVAQTLLETLVQKEAFPYAPEFAFNTAVIFILAGLILLLMHNIRRRWAGNLLHLFSIVLVLFGVLDLVNDLLDLDLLYEWYRYEKLSFVSGVSAFLLGLGLYSLIQYQPWYKNLNLDREDRKITIISATLLSIFAFVCGLVIFATMARQMEEAFKNNLIITLDSRLRLFKSTIDNSIEDAVFHSRRSRLAAVVGKIAAGNATADDQRELNKTLDRVLSMSSGHISAISFYNYAGKKIVQRGEFVTDSEFQYTLPLKQKAVLLWHDGFVLNIKVNYADDKHISYLSVDMPLEKISALFYELNGLGKTGVMTVCAPYEDQYLSCPLSPGRTQKSRIPRYPDVPSPMTLAIEGRAGVMTVPGRRNREIISAYAPIGSLGLGMTVKVDKAELYQPLRARFEHTLLILIGSVILGVILLRWQVVPLVRKLLNEVNERKRAEEESRLLQAISQAIGGAKDIHAALEIVLCKVCETTGWKLGQAWVPRADGTVLECSGAWYTCIAGVEKFRLANQAFAFGPGRGLPGRVWSSKKPEWMRNIAGSKTSRRAHLFPEIGLQVGTGIPILAGDEVVAVMEFFTSEMHAEDTRLVTLISSMAAQIGVVIQRERVQTALDVTEERYRTLIHNCVEAIYLYDPETRRVIEANAAFLNLLGYTAEEASALFMYDFIVHNKESIGSFSAALKTTGGIAIGERIWRSKDGRLINMDVTAGRIWTGNKSIGFTVARDITAQKQAEARLNYLAHYDELTGLPNRVLFNDRLKQAMMEAADNGRLVALMFLDLDRFKTINDTLGHETGDKLLKTVSDRLKECLRRGDTISRQGGDEFALVLADIARTDDVSRLAQKILDSFIVPFRIDGRDLFVTPSIGITLYPLDQDDVNSLLKNADTAMYRAKEQGRNNYQFYTVEMNTRALERLALETNLRQAAERNEFTLHYQPQVNLTTGNVIGMEALLRWQNPQLGSVSPAEFIPLAEETGLIVSIGEWVLRTACKQNKAWQDAGLSQLRVSVNLSARQFKEKNLVERVAQILKETGLEARYLELELTESLLQNPEATITPLKELHALGVRLSIDDFGTGYSSLSYLKRFPIDTIKIDRSFVRDITTDADDAAIANAIITLAHSLGVHVVAEGVETSEQLAFLCQHKCDLMQGYYFSKPLPIDVFTDFIKDKPRLTVSQRWIASDLKVGLA